MKTTVELPDSLVREIKRRAVHERRKMKDMVADLLQKGLAFPESISSEEPRAYLGFAERSELPLIHCQHPARSHQQLTPERVASILHEQEVAWQDETARH